MRGTGDEGDQGWGGPGLRGTGDEGDQCLFST